MPSSIGHGAPLPPSPTAHHFTLFSALCRYGELPTFSAEFLDATRQAFAKSSGKWSEEDYFKIFDQFGTHYVTEVLMGSRYGYAAARRACAIPPVPLPAWDTQPAPPS